MFNFLFSYLYLFPLSIHKSIALDNSLDCEFHSLRMLVRCYLKLILIIHKQRHIDLWLRTYRQTLQVTIQNVRVEPRRGGPYFIVLSYGKQWHWSLQSCEHFISVLVYCKQWHWWHRRVGLYTFFLPVVKLTVI